MRNYWRNILLMLIAFVWYDATASHVVGGEMTYKYTGSNSYEVTLTLYIDYLNGQPSAIAQDNPAFFGIYDGAGKPVFFDTSVFYTSSEMISAYSSSPCGTVVHSASLMKKTFVSSYTLPPNNTGYVITYQRCCRNAGIVNVTDPGNNGATYFCNIPAKPVINTSAVFKNEPPQIICLDKALYYDHSATDADGDSLSYGFCAALNGTTPGNIKPIPSGPPYDSVIYNMPYTSGSPLDGSPAIQIDTVTGVMTGTPTRIGRYLVNVACYEWRGGVLINTIRREMQFIVNVCGSSFKPHGSPDTVIMVGESVEFNASGATSYTWTPGFYLSDMGIYNPVGHFPLAGLFTYVVHGISDSGCSGNDTVRVQVLDHSSYVLPGAFTPNGDNRNDLLKPIPLENSVLKSFKIFDRKGREVFETSDALSGWDGTYHSVKQDLGTYYWELLYDDNSGKSRILKGSTTLVR